MSQTESFSVVPTEEAIFVVGAFTLLKPEGFSESPVQRFRKDTNKKLQLQQFAFPKGVSGIQSIHVQEMTGITGC